MNKNIRTKSLLWNSQGRIVVSATELKCHNTIRISEIGLKEGNVRRKEKGLTCEGLSCGQQERPFTAGSRINIIKMTALIKPNRYQVPHAKRNGGVWQMRMGWECQRLEPPDDFTQN